ncbi:sec-independent protein translocase protein TATA, chloroplastic isoform X2 [Ricinus communis]|uniref:sec-independent protein translocase protein TATA, chloroplastic isoform X2 n=1 Tax=Ricinus communis TaxID=3988 RepID=UPI00201A5497|nr:sec-independent protein translocase protein TATA, chloroplastic isoform X2 [Ricinus communis]
MEISSMTLSLSRPTHAFPFSSSHSTFFNNANLLNTNKKLSNKTLVLGKTRSRTERTRKGLTCNALFGLGVPELVVIAGVAALVFGPKKLPEVGRSIGKTVKSFQEKRFVIDQHSWKHFMTFVWQCFKAHLWSLGLKIFSYFW